MSTPVTADFKDTASSVRWRDEGKITGSSAEVVREILRRLNQPDNITILPWARGYHLLKSRPNVVLFSTTRTKERENLFHWVGPLCTSRIGFYKKKICDPDQFP
jgi:polar amino acid transport system substrate-binding protein